jgi:spermidine synthase
LLLLLFAGSGCAALIYEIVWLQLVQLVVGSTASAMAVLLGTFMGGMCIGSLALPRLVPVHSHPLRVWAALELGLGGCGIAILAGLPWLQRLPFASAACTLCLLPPTILMGATLPVISRFADRSRWGFFYAANIGGGIAGCLIAGFWLLRVYDMAAATWVAVGINVALAAAGCVLAARAPFQAEAPAMESGPPRKAPRAVFVAIGISGLCALGAEVVWTRLLALTLGPTVYTFSIILAVFLGGLGLGSWAGAALAKRTGNARRALAGCQILLLGAIPWAGYTIANQLPYWDKNLSVHANPWLGFLFDLGCCAVAILPATMLWGASFPLALEGAAAPGRDSGRVVGEIYAANTLGAILGAAGFSLLTIAWVGSQNSERWLAALSGVAAVVAMGWSGRRLAPAVALATAALAWATPAVPWKLLAFGRRMPMENGPWKKLYAAEGRNSSIAYTEWVDKRRFFHVAGKIEASSSPFDMTLQRLLGHLPALLHPNPKSVLIVGCGAGVTAGSFVPHPEVERITLCEIEPLIPPASGRYFARENNGVMADRRTRVAIDDARHFILTTKEKFDIVTSDPIHPWVKGAATLYSKEYFEMVRAHLKPGGFTTQWVPLYESDVETVRSEIATFVEVFPDATIWGNTDMFDQGYDLVLLGADRPIRIDVDEVQRRIDHVSSGYEADYKSAADLLGVYASRAPDLREWLAGAQIDRDRGLRLQYLAGMALNQSLAGWIYGEILRRSPFPEDLFTGSPARVAEVRKAFDDWRRDPY